MPVFNRCLLVVSLLTVFPHVHAQDNDDDETLDMLMVTGTRIRAGGAQDIAYFRDSALENGEMPRPESLTVEGLLSEHDLNLPLSRRCNQTLCLATEAMAQTLPSRPDDRLFVGLGFTSNVDAATWKREPLNLVAVVDQSGSMSDEPIALVQRALTKIVKQLHAGDRISIILYGDAAHVHLAPAAIRSDRERILRSIADIPIVGSTNMEEGLQLGFAIANTEAAKFKGNTRVMLFTDEQPNVGATGAESFMGMAQTASKNGIGMTTIGVGVQYDGALATRIGSVRGGNLFFVADEKSVNRLFAEQLDTMVSEIAHDIRISLTPTTGYRISGIFGVPDSLMEQGRDGEISIVVPTAFFSTTGGGIFLSLGKDSAHSFLPATRLKTDAPLLSLRLEYLSALDGKSHQDKLVVNPPEGSPSASLREAFALIDQFLVMRDASVVYHREGKPKEAFKLLSALLTRMQQAQLPTLEQELLLVKAMTDKAALMSGYAGEVSAELRAEALYGLWEVLSCTSDLFATGDQLEFDEDHTLYFTRKKTESEETEDYTFDGEQLKLAELEFKVLMAGEGATLIATQGEHQIELKRVTQFE